MSLPLVLVGVGSPHVRLLRRGPRGREAERLLKVLSDAHGAENVEEDEGAVCVVLTQQVPARKFRILDSVARYSMIIVLCALMSCANNIQNRVFNLVKNLKISRYTLQK